MRQLKEWSGLTLRQLEERAAARGDVLARSTAADILRRSTLPRPALVAAFVRACGDGDRLPEWTRAYERVIAAAVLEPTAGSAEPRATPDDHPEPAPGTSAEPVLFATSAEPRVTADPTSPAPRPLTRERLLAVAFVLVVVAVVTSVLDFTAFKDQPITNPPVGDPADTSETLALAPAGHWAGIRPARTPDLCVTEGRDRAGRYDSAVAVQRPCAEPGPRTFLQPVATGLVNIKWEHPEDRGLGCLTVMDHEPAPGLLEPQDNCLADKDAQLFRVERVPGSRAFRLRRAGGDLCLAIADDETAPGAEVVQRPCSDGAAQHFLVDLLPGA
ncbi:RICIN domain-containing protein [Saccharothrix syringae]|uniref:XRE family transcriptional regulator n=1 Tax=Saccharothrix syringae TaxID=103733 RepID=A0A5Q0GSI9_SACSY|nr:RICIN domain-containing protein [Saccharothrix syringae]QFZ17056.1 XRE family transcriptional regulator [Saccharothrix syringae]